MVQGLRHLVIDQHRDGVEDTVPAHLLPFAFTDVIAKLTGKARLLEDLSDLQQALALMTHEFPDRYSAALVMFYDPRLDNFRVDEGHAADDAIALQPCDESIFR